MLTCDLHAPAIEGFFDIPVDHLQARMLPAQHIHELDLPPTELSLPMPGGSAGRWSSASGLAVTPTSP